MDARREFLLDRIRRLERKIERLEADYQTAVGKALDHGYRSAWGALARYVARRHRLRKRWAERKLEEARNALDAHDLVIDHRERVKRGWDFHEDLEE